MKFKIGDYIAPPGGVYIKILAVYEGGTMPLYAATCIEHNMHVNWYSEYDLERRGATVGKPNFDMARNLQPGDILADGVGSYLTVQARIGSAILLSQPANRDARGALAGMDDLRDAGFSFLGDEKQIRDDLEHLGSMKKIQLIAGRWFEVDKIALLRLTKVTE